jgi:hypothetical protein
MVWSEVSMGRHVLVRGRAPVVPAEWLVVCVDCGHLARGHDALHEAVQRIHDTLGDGGGSMRMAAAHIGAARRLLDDDDDRVPFEARFVEACNELAAQADQPSALLLGSLEHADDETIASLGRVLGQARWLILPLVLHVEDAARRPELDDIVERSGGTVLANADSPAPGSAPAAERPDAKAPWDWRQVPPASLSVRPRPSAGASMASRSPG